jgi:hypothetical protein
MNSLGGRGVVWGAVKPPWASVWLQTSGLVTGPVGVFESAPFWNSERRSSQGRRSCPFFSTKLAPSAHLQGLPIAEGGCRTSTPRASPFPLSSFFPSSPQKHNTAESTPVATAFKNCAVPCLPQKKLASESHTGLLREVYDIYESSY